LVGAILFYTKDSMLNKITVNLMVKNIQKTVKFYQEHLQFDFVMGVPADKNKVIFENDSNRKLVYALVKHNEIELMLCF